MLSHCKLACTVVKFQTDTLHQHCSLTCGPYVIFLFKKVAIALGVATT